MAMMLGHREWSVICEEAVELLRLGLLRSL